ncbi:MAG: hypothetical protein KKE11_03300 [Gammaproteobacteria bacterium]|nr:hypothetical protein [Gammaproteobacteria bacterium]
MNRLSKIFLLILSIAFLSGCVTPEHNVKLPNSFWQTTNHKITVAKTKPKNKPALYKTGQQGVLDMAISAAVTQTLNKHLAKTNLDWYYKGLPQKFVTRLKQHNISSQIYQINIDPKQKKNATAIVHMDGDKLLLLELQTLGAIRNYYGFIPLGVPRAYCHLKGELIDKQNKNVLWRHVAKIEERVQGNWDQPPSYPNFTNALKEAVNSAQEEIIDSFFSGH